MTHLDQYRGPVTSKHLLAFSDGHIDRHGIPTLKGERRRRQDAVEVQRHRVRNLIQHKRQMLLSDWPAESLPKALQHCDGNIRDALRFYRLAQRNLALLPVRQPDEHRILVEFV